MSKDENIITKLKVNIDISAEDLLQLHEVRIKDFQLSEFFLLFSDYRQAWKGRSVYNLSGRQTESGPRPGK